MQMLVHTGLLYMSKILKLVIFDSFGVEHVSEEIENFIGHKNVKTNIFRMQTNNSIMCGYFCIGFIDFFFFFAWKTLIDYINLFSPYFFLMTMYSWVILRMNAVHSFEGIDASNLSDQTKFRLSKIIKTEDYFKREKEKKGEKNNE